MPIRDRLKPWHGHAIRHIPRPADPMDFGHCGRSLDHRWNRSGEPTLYLASDRSVALAEFSRHFDGSRTKSLMDKLLQRAVYDYHLRLDSTLDLTNKKAVETLSLGPRTSFLEKGVCRATAGFIRTTTPAQAIFVRSIAFLDDPSKWCLVLFLEKLGPDVGKVFAGVKEIGW